MRRLLLIAAALALGSAGMAAASPATGLVGVAEARRASTNATCTAAEVTVRDWVSGWKAKKFRRMVELSQVTWRLHARNPVQTLRDQYGFKDVLTYRFVRCTANPVSARVTFRIKYRDFKVRHVQITAMVIRENAQSSPSAFGRWGVNPISTLREDPVR